MKIAVKIILFLLLISCAEISQHPNKNVGNAAEIDNVAITAPTKKIFSSVEILPTIRTVPHVMLPNGANTGVGLQYGILGSAIVTAVQGAVIDALSPDMSDLPKKTLAEAFKENDIDVKEMIKQQLAKEIQEQKFSDTVTSESPEYSILVAVQGLGVRPSNPGAFGNPNFSPFIDTSVEVINNRTGQRYIVDPYFRTLN